MDLLSLVARLTLDKSDYDDGLKDAESEGSSFGDKLATGFKVVAGGVGAVVGATTAVGAAFVSSAGDVASYGDNIDKASQKLGISAEAYQEWDAILQHSGTSMSALKGGMKTLNKAIENLGSASGEAVVDQDKLTEAQVKYDNSLLNVEKAQLEYVDALEKYGEESQEAQKKEIALQKARNDSELAQQKLNKVMEGSTPTLSEAGEALQSLGISAVDSSGNLRDQEEVFSEVITALQGMENETERTRLATVLLGRGGQELGALLNTSAEDTEAMRQRVHELGGVMSDEAVKASAAYQDSLQDMNTAIDGVKRGVVSDFLPSITSVMDGLGNLFSGDSESGLGQIKDGASQFIQTLTDTIPQVLDVGIGIITALGEAILENLPTIFEAGVNAILSLAEGIGDALPELIPAAVDAILTLAESLIDNIDKVVEAALKIMVGLAVGLVKAIPKLIEKAPIIIAKLVKALIELLPEIAQAGMDLLSSLTNGMTDKIPEAVKAMKNTITKILTAIKDNFSNIKEKAKELLSKFVNGIIDSIPKVVQGIGNVLTKLLSAIKEKLPQMLAKGGEIIANIATGIIQAIPKIASAIPQVIREIKDKFTSIDWGSVGKNIIDGVAQGIRNFAYTIGNAVTNVGSSALGSIKKALGISSPSKVFRDEVGKWIPEGIAVGIEANTDSVKSALGDLSDMTEETFDPNLNVGSRGISGDSVTINVYGAEGQDVRELAQIVSEMISDRTERRRAVFA